MEVSGQLSAPAALHPGREFVILTEEGSWVGLRTSLNVLEKKHFLTCDRNRTPHSLAQVGVLYKGCESSIYMLR
jgi:hypothetical protein